MSHRYLKDMFDIHGGGLDLRFPHHENEMAQTRAAGYDSAARWMHSAWVTAKGEKMSKSLGNGLSVPAVLAEPFRLGGALRPRFRAVPFHAGMVRPDACRGAVRVRRVANFIERAGAAVGEQPSREEIMAISADALPADFVAAMNDDINVSGSSAAIFTAIRSGNTLLSKLADRADSDVAKAEVREALVNVRAMLDTLGLDPLAEPWVSDGAQVVRLVPEPIPPSMTRSTSWFPNSLRNVPKRARPRISHVPTRSVTRWARPASPSRTVRKAPFGR